MSRKLILLFPLMMIAMVLVAITGVVLGIVCMIPLLVKPDMAGPIVSYFGERIARELTQMIFARNRAKTGGSTPFPFDIGV
jgi:hypothetical protein